MLKAILVNTIIEVPLLVIEGSFFYLISVFLLVGVLCTYTSLCHILSNYEVIFKD